MLNEELLTAWMRVTTTINNHRLAADLPFNEALVCGLVMRFQEKEGCATASGLCAATHILKSQMNAILTSLERKGILERRRSEGDRRRVELRLRPEGRERFEAAHRQNLALVDRFIAGMGEDGARALLPLLRQAADVFQEME